MTAWSSGSQDAVDAFLRYCYTDKLEGCDAAERTASCLAVAVYYGTPHLVQLCELSLVEELQTFDEGEAPAFRVLRQDTWTMWEAAHSVEALRWHHGRVDLACINCQLTCRHRLRSVERCG